MRKDVYTTGEAATIARISHMTIIRCIDAGRLKGYRVPGSRHRRIERVELERFLKEHGIPTDRLEADLTNPEPGTRNPERGRV